MCWHACWRRSWRRNPGFFDVEERLQRLSTLIASVTTLCASGGTNLASLTSPPGVRTCLGGLCWLVRQAERM